MRIYEITKKLDDVAPGGIFRFRGYTDKRYLKTNNERAGTVLVVDTQTGDVANIYTATTVIELEGATL